MLLTRANEVIERIGDNGHDWRQADIPVALMNARYRGQAEDE